MLVVPAELGQLKMPSANIAKYPWVGGEGFRTAELKEGKLEWGEGVETEVGPS